MRSERAAIGVPVEFNPRTPVALQTEMHCSVPFLAMYIWSNAPEVHRCYPAGSAPALYTNHPEPMSLGSGSQGDIVSGHNQLTIHGLAPE